MRSRAIIWGMFFTLTALAISLMLSTCGGGKQSSVVNLQSSDRSGGQPQQRVAPPIQAVVSLDSTLAELDALETPDGVDAALFQELKDALGEALAMHASSVGRGFTPRRDTSADGAAAAHKGPPYRIVSTPPTGEANRVNDLTITDNGDGTYALTWHYRNLGDYDQDGTVTVDDIILLAEHFGEEVPDKDDNSLQAVIDGSGSGVVDIADITPLAMNLGTSCTSYIVMQTESLEGEWQEIGSVALEEATGNGRLALTYCDSIPTQEIRYARVVPIDAQGIQGVPAKPVTMPGHEWLHTWSGNASDVGLALTVDGSGSVYVAGYSVSFTSGGFVLLKYDPNGHLLWGKLWSENGGFGFGLGHDRTGNVYVTGFAGGVGSDNSDNILLKYESGGNLLWQKAWSGGVNDYSFSVAVDGSGDVYVTGSTQLSGSVDSSVVLLKYNPSGDILWQKNWGKGGGEACAIDDSGNVHLVGITTGFGAGSSDIVLLRFDSNGDLLQQKTWGGSNADSGYDIAVDGNGNVYIAGCTSSFGAGSADVLLLKCNPSGELLWQKTWGGFHRDKGFAVAVDGCGSIYVTGRTYSFTAGSPDIILLEYDTSGSLIRQKIWGGSDYDCGCAIEVDCDGSLYIGGSTRSPYGSWQNVCGQVSNPAGTIDTPDGAVSVPNGNEITLDGIEASPEGVEDAGDGWEKILVMKLDPRLL